MVDVGDQSGQHDQIVAQLSVVVRIGLGQLDEEHIADLADATLCAELADHVLIVAVLQQVPNDLH